jgi:hypothetical protein
MLWLNRIFLDRVDAAKQLVEACKKSISCYHLLPPVTVLLSLLPLSYLCYQLFPTVTNTQYFNLENL